ncbi:MAG: choice-of-anchor D domain-containing protein [Deltaproteobacteria bacterium]|nr:choice-of-anchor D domain-containing protein [Deltaproteobacteria bacterium]
MSHKCLKTLVATIFLSQLALGACECADNRLGANLAELSADPNPVLFGEVPVSTVKTIDVTLTNRGTGQVWLHDLFVVDNEEDFSISVPDEITFPHAILAGQQVVFSVRYHPQQYPENDKSAIRIESTDKDAPEYDLPCLGTAVEPILLVEPVPVDFGSERVMDTAPATITITHTGSTSDPVTISTLQITDDGDGDFHIQQADDTPLTLNPGEITRVNLSYTPLLIDDSDEGIFTIESDAESQEHMEVPLLGSSHAPQIEVDTTGLNFGTVTLGAHPTLPFNIKNIGNDPLNIIELKLTDTGSQNFTFAPTSITDPIQPLDQVEVRVTYDAIDRGDSHGTLMIRHDDPLNPSVFVQLNGRTPAPDIDLDPNMFCFVLAKESTTQTLEIKIKNVGDENLSVTGMDFSNPDGSFSIDSQPIYPATVLPNEYESLVVRFTKDTATVDDECTLAFSSDDPDEETVIVIGTGKYTP